MAPLFPATTDVEVYSVSELTAILKQFISGRFRSVRVEGEVSNAKLYQSGHLYFTLKDNEAMMKAVVFGYYRKFPDKDIIKDGDTVICEGKIDIYEKRGEYQLIVNDLTIQIYQGNLYLKFLALKEKLFKEGLFDEIHKKPLPFFPERIGIVTSPSGAAIRDMLRIIYGKFDNVSVLIYPVKVQGEEAPGEIVAGIDYFNENLMADVIIVGRGGGSLEDLSPFNEEIVARAIFASTIPVVSAVGHEIDFTISDFVADVRAPTPTAAADIVVRDKDELSGTIGAFRKSLLQGMENKIERSRFSLYKCTTDLKDRKDYFASQSIYIDELQNSLIQGFTNYMKDMRTRMDTLSQRIADLNPENILRRGYSITQKKETGEIVFDSSDVDSDDRLIINLFKGKIDATVTGKQPSDFPKT